MCNITIPRFNCTSASFFFCNILFVPMHNPWTQYLMPMTSCLSIMLIEQVAWLLAGFFDWATSFSHCPQHLFQDFFVVKMIDWIGFLPLLKWLSFRPSSVWRRGVMPADYGVQVQTSPVLVWFMGWTTEEHWCGSLLEIKTSTRTFQRTLNW